MLRLMKPKIRLYVDHPLGEGQQVSLTREQAHYLFGVMRLGTGDRVGLFNGADGEWASVVLDAGKRGGTLCCEAQSASQALPPDLWLVFAPIKKTRTDFIVEKAVEMGVREILPVQTEFTNSERIRQDRLQAHAVEAAEQCGGTFVPRVHDLQRLDRVLADLDSTRRILFCEMMAADAFPIMGSMTKWAGIEDYDTRMLCGEPTLQPRLKDIPIRIPQPQPDVPISIYEIQKGLKTRAFETAKA